jgi:D-3-phosphoglycerate dehydrogenase / 2-oxoglutarate reductase
MSKLIIITDCDHPSVEIEKKIIEEKGLRVVVEQCKTEEDLIAKCKEADGLINQYAPITDRVLSELPKCQVVVRYGVGVDNVDLEAASKHGVKICNVPDYGVEEVSDHALGLIFSTVRKINLLSNDVKQAQNWNFEIAQPIRRLRDLTLGVVGLGRIGEATARKAVGMGWNVIASDQYKTATGVESVNIVPFDELIETADIISIHTPFTTETHHLFNKDVFKKMKNTAFVINTARGPIVNEADLAEALRLGEIAGAGIDVLEQEPPVKDHELFSLENIVLTPHAAWYSIEAAQDLKSKAAEEAANVVLGKEPKNLVNQLGKVGTK